MRMRENGPAMTLRAICLVIVAFFTAHSAHAADAKEGQRLAQARCAPCHIVVPHQREELARSPPFDAIARKAEFNAGMLAYLILAPHPGMNMTLTRWEADDIAAYIVTLGK
jgi:mono/diheme cytochrome c family protein